MSRDPDETYESQHIPGCNGGCSGDSHAFLPEPPINGTAHVVPRGDLVEHETSDDCPCGPTAQPVTRDDGSVGWVMLHHSLDGRERGES
jgi:hypothetical protein